MKPGQRKIQRQGGFTLLEVLVAFTIFAVTFTAVLQILSTSSRNDEIAELYGLAVSHAESLIARTGIETPLAAGESSGVLDQGLRWHRIISRHVEASVPGVETGGGGFAVPFSVEVSISWGEGAHARSLTLSTLRLGAPG
ncbi:prepilin-type N-terminal cleavage/methylation domain-containing protein [Pelagibius sp. Alg239-R121]|uniref:type IV pilus modification PilV family protein n=1 Tax=Pelagibius sp. Alg239-R121 TaxID=2993448 RepID=UPI0024A60C85|nr:type II secretion system protein [Pelagibius sp. Alg239-R121]